MFLGNNFEVENLLVGEQLVDHLCAGCSNDGFAWDDEINQGSAGYGDDYAEEDALAKEHNSVWDEW